MRAPEKPMHGGNGTITNVTPATMPTQHRAVLLYNMPVALAHQESSHCNSYCCNFVPESGRKSQQQLFATAWFLSDTEGRRPVKSKPKQTWQLLLLQLLLPAGLSQL
jgi:hypothetical protein